MELFFYAIAFVLGIWLGYFIGWWRGYGEWNRAYRDCILTGTGFIKDGKRINPENVFKP